jgi:L-alanine-DL-glutamate epimerase-like enolase superfamily enzyme
MLDDQGLLWIEEPLPHDDHANYRRLRSRTKTPIQMGENFISPHSMMTALAGGCTDYVMPDVERIGGVSGWIDAASLAASHNVEMSSHLFPEISAHLLAATATCHWLEYVDWADPILNEPLQITDGMATANGSPEPESPGMRTPLAVISRTDPAGLHTQAGSTVHRPPEPHSNMLYDSVEAGFDGLVRSLLT